MKNAKLGLHWFASLPHLSSRRPSPAKEHDGRSAPEQPGFARSKDVSSLWGTAPRREGGGGRAPGEKKRRRGREEGAGPRRGWAGEQAPPSPLLSALSGRSLVSVQRPAPGSAAATRPLPSTPDLRPHSPLTSRTCSMKSCETRTSSAADPPEGRRTQELYELMERPPPPQESSLSQEVGGANRQQEVADGGGEYVKFSKEKFWLEPPSETLRKQLEEELKLSSTNLRSHAWYHGPIPWEVSESLVVNQGDFLVRDSQSSPGDFVLTASWDQRTVHFLVRRSVLQSSETSSRLQFSLREEEACSFHSLPALVHFYVGSSVALSRPAGAQILQPVSRTLPLSFLETAFGPTSGKDGGRSGEEAERSRSPSAGQPLEEDVSLPPPADPPLSAESCSHTPPPGSPRSSRVASVAASPSPSSSRRSNASPPPPSPGGTLHRPRPSTPRPPPNQLFPCAEPEASCYTELHPGPQGFVERLRAEDGVEQLRPDHGNVYFSPVVETASSFRPSSYRSVLMPKENKPLEVGILRQVKELLAEVDPEAAAKHITKSDCLVARILEVTTDAQRMMGVSSGMELLTLPHGQQLRLDLLERSQTMAIMLAVDVLGCTGSTEERAGLLHKIIRIAAELKSNMGNMFGFAAVMRALELPQVARLDQTWTTLRQRHTEGAILYEKTLRPFMKSLNDGRESCPLSSTTFPHVLPLVSLLERNVAVCDGPEPWETVEAGVDVVMFHLGAARTIAQLGGIYSSNAQSKLQGFQEQADISELFQTDFQMRLLWGSRGAEEAQALRYAKFEQVLTALSNRLEPPGRRR